MAVTLIHHWDFHENTGTTVADIVGGNDGHVSAGSTMGQDFKWVAGINGGTALECNGQSVYDYDHIYTEDAVASGGIGPFAISVWMKQPTFYTGVLVGLDPDQTSEGSTSTGNFLAVTTNATQSETNLTFGGDPASWLSYGIDLSGGDWHHIVGAWCDGTARIYIDKSKVAEGSVTEHTAAGYWRLFGTQVNTALITNLAIAATIADVRIYAGCITDCEVAAIYDGLDPAICNQPANAMMFSCNT